MFKEKVKIWHDKKIKRKEFKVGDQASLEMAGTISHTGSVPFRSYPSL